MKERACFLFGHSDAPDRILPELEVEIKNEIMKGTRYFYIGYHGNFDCLGTLALKAVKAKHNEITAMLLLAYHPAEQSISLPQGFAGSYYPLVDKIPRKFAIVKTNQYMIRNVDSIICYVQHFGNTRNLLEYARSQAKKREIAICNLADE